MNKFLSVVLLIILLASCSVSNITLIEPQPFKHNINELINKVNTQPENEDNLHLKGSLTYITNREQVKLDISIVNKKDSIIWLSATGPFGLEVIRLQITPDTIYLLNRINKTAFVKPLDNAKEFIHTNADFNTLQAIITSRINILKSEYQYNIGFNEYVLESKDIKYIISDFYKVIQAEFKKDFLQLNFYNFNEQNFAQEIVLKISFPESIEVLLKYSKIESNNTKNTPFSIPKSYEKNL